MGTWVPESARKPSVGSLTSWVQKWQKNEIFEAIQAVGLNPREFDLENDGAEVRVRHKWSASCFTIGGGPGHYVCANIVGDAPTFGPLDAFSWQAVLPRIRRWLEDVKRDLETPDLWAELQRQAELFGASSEDVIENTPFNQGEQNVIAERLQELAEHASRTYSLTAAQMRVLEAKLDYLVNAARRLGRKDWLNVCAGVILGYILAASLPPEAAHNMFLGLLQAIGHLYGFPALPPG